MYLHRLECLQVLSNAALGGRAERWGGGGGGGVKGAMALSAERLVLKADCKHKQAKLSWLNVHETTTTLTGAHPKG